MNARTHGFAALAWLGVLAVAVPAPSALAQEPDAYGDGYASGEAGRVLYHEGGATLLRAPGSQEIDRREDAASNAPIFPGDRILTDARQRVEVQLAGGTLIRVDRNSEIAFEALPRPYAKFQDNTVLGFTAGTIQVAPRVAEDEEFRVDTSAGSVYLLGDGDFRIDADPSGAMSVVSKRGVAEVVGSGGSVLVRGGMGTVVYPGAIPEEPQPVNSLDYDAFDRWAAARDDAYRVPDAVAGGAAPPPEELPYEVRPYYGELSASGSWVDTPDYGWVWMPSSVGSGWRPYSDGYWDWGPGGYFWVSYEPWGWAPYRYGRWGWYGGSWCWIPGSVFGGAWVSWSWGSAWIGWAPLGYWGGPVYIGGPVYYDWYDPHCWTFVHTDHFDHHDVRRVAVPVGNVGEAVRRNAVVVRAPDVSPRRVAHTTEGRMTAARRAAEDRGGRITEPTRAGRATGLGLGDVDRRVRATRGAVASPAEGRSATRRDAAVTPSKPGVRTPAPGRETGARIARAGERTAPGGSRSKPEAGKRQERSAQAPTTPYQRRIVQDPRRREDPGAARSAPRPSAPAEPQRVQPRGSTGDDRVRDLYDRMSGPRRPREVPSTPQSARPAPQRGKSDRSTPAPQVRPQRSTPSPRETPRVAPSRPSAPRQTPRAAPSRPSAPREAPRAAPSRPSAPRQESSGSGSRSGERSGQGSSGSGSRSGGRSSQGKGGGRGR